MSHSIPLCQTSADPPSTLVPAGVLLPSLLLPSEASENPVEGVLDVWRLARELFLLPEELAPAYQTVHQITDWCGQVNNGGLLQFIDNRGWDTTALQAMAAALDDIGAEGHAALCRLGLDELGPEVADELSDAQLAFCDHFDEAFYALSSAEPRLATWLRAHPDAIVVPFDTAASEVRKAAEAIPDLAARRRAGELSVPFVFRLFDALCDQARLRASALELRVGPAGPGLYGRAESWLPWRRPQWLTVTVDGTTAQLVDARSRRCYARTRLTTEQLEALRATM